jgi:phosphatidylserine/phosphatidylglycerophosphate/cardiolipin synthase-like enzyme
MSTEVHLFLAKPASPVHLREAYPYGPSAAGFHTDLAIEVDPAVLTESSALATVSGLVRWIPNITLDTGSLILVPSPSELPGISSIVGRTLVFFVYRNLDFDSMVTRLQPRIEAPENQPSPQGDSTTRLMEFVNGHFSIWVESGEELGLPSTNGGTNGWARLGFEIVYMPSIAFEDKGLMRIVELTKPEALTRRLEPMSFYASVQAATTGIELAPIHLDHPLLTIPTRRTLLELRDERDRPYDSLDIEIQKGSDPSIVFTSTTANRGMIELDVLAPNAVASAATYKVWRNLYVFTELPSGKKALDILTSKPLTAPAHWVFQALCMNNIADMDNWFVANNDDLSLPMYTANNTVTPLRDGVAVFNSYTRAIRTLSDPAHYMYLAGLVMMDDFELVRGDTLSTMAELIFWAAAIEHAMVRVMLWEDRSGDTNAGEWSRINNLGASGHNAQAVLDGHTHACLTLPALRTGTHHQKLLVISGEKGRIAFCGGVDVNRNRRDSPNHGALGGYHDVHAKIKGPAVTDIERVFAARWNTHPSSLAVNSTVPTPPPSPNNLDDSTGSVYVQVACTFPNRGAAPVYPFAPSGSFTPLEAFLHAIKKAEKFIYIEDQYLTPYPGGSPYDEDDDPLSILYELRQALTRPQNPIDYLIMVIPNYTNLSWLNKITPFEGQARYRRQQFINSLLEIAPTKVHVFYLGRPLPLRPRLNLGEVATEGDGAGTSGGPGRRDEIYCHSKVWIIDDVIAKIGSANCNQRSYTHDSEMDIVMVDGAVSNGARAFARNFRLQLWGEHLGMSSFPKNALLEDHLMAREFWLRQPQPYNSHILPYLHDQEIETNAHTGWRNLVDPDGRGMH